MTVRCRAEARRRWPPGLQTRRPSPIGGTLLWLTAAGILSNARAKRNVCGLEVDI